jgi:hypothetical protein
MCIRHQPSHSSSSHCLAPQTAEYTPCYVVFREHDVHLPFHTSEVQATVVLQAVHLTVGDEESTRP